jgi:hypothetical protein
MTRGSLPRNGYAYPILAEPRTRTPAHQT